MAEQNPNEYRVPRRVNDPLTLIFWPVHHVIPIFMALAASVILGNTLLYLALGVFWFYFIREIERKFPRGYLIHRIWWFGFPDAESKTVPDSQKREFFQ